jgi:hypothetical protein
MIRLLVMIMMACSAGTLSDVNNRAFKAPGPNREEQGGKVTEAVVGHLRYIQWTGL